MHLRRVTDAELCRAQAYIALGAVGDFETTGDVAGPRALTSMDKIRPGIEGLTLGPVEVRNYNGDEVKK